MLEYFQTLNRYNRWMNEKLYATGAAMSDEERKHDFGAPFRSIHGILNHLLLTDRMWLGRFKAQPFPARSLDQELYSNFEELRAERCKTDDEIEAWVVSLDEQALPAPFTFTSFSIPQTATLLLWQTALHLFNHQTHHRGQITALIEASGHDCGVTDLAQMVRQEKS